MCTVCTGHHGGSSGGIPKAQAAVLVLSGFALTAAMRKEQEQRQFRRSQHFAFIGGCGHWGCQGGRGRAVTQLEPEGDFGDRYLRGGPRAGGRGKEGPGPARSSQKVAARCADG